MEFKRVGTFSVILLNLPTPPLKQSWIWSKMGENECFFGPQHCWEKCLDDGRNPKPNKTLSLGAGSYVTIAWKGFFTQSQVLLSSVVCLLSGPTRDESHVCSGTWTGSTNVSLHSLQAWRTRIQKGPFRRRRCYLLSHWLGMKILADNTLAEKRANYFPDLWNPKLLTHFRNDMFTPKANDQLMRVVNHRSRSKAGDPLEDDLICRVDGGWRG